MRLGLAWCFKRLNVMSYNVRKTELPATAGLQQFIPGVWFYNPSTVHILFDYLPTTGDRPSLPIQLARYHASELRKVARIASWCLIRVQSHFSFSWNKEFVLTWYVESRWLRFKWFTVMIWYFICQIIGIFLPSFDTKNIPPVALNMTEMRRTKEIVTNANELNEWKRIGNIGLFERFAFFSVTRHSYVIINRFT